ncbi:MAG: hypothetical protein IJ320_04615 [Phascolarctobacterium sp.]|nr:hypothetical protein [Phascolarctobacterium sp.]
MKSAQPITKFVAYLKNEIRKKLRQHTYRIQLTADTCDICCCELKALLEENSQQFNEQANSLKLELALEFFKSVIQLKALLPASCEALNLYALDIASLLCQITTAISQNDEEQPKVEAFAQILKLAQNKSTQPDERYSLLEAALPLLTKDNAAELHYQVEALSKKVPATGEYIAKHILLTEQLQEKLKDLE